MLEVYEVEIIGESSAYYKVRWSNDDVSNKAKKRMNTMAEYYKLVTLWKEKQSYASISTSSTSSASLAPPVTLVSPVPSITPPTPPIPLIPPTTSNAPSSAVTTQ